MGAVPSDYPLFRAARYMGVAPWELLERSVYWQQRAILFEAAENEAAETRQRQAQEGAG